MRYFHSALAVFCAAFTCGVYTLGPVAGAQGPATQPSAEGRILVLPFAALNQSQYQQWLGRSIQQSLLADLTSLAPGRVVAAEKEASDMSAALDIARRNGAQYVVDGSFVVSGRELRLTGQLIDVAAGRAIAGIKATGPAVQIFRLEDQLAMQIRGPLGLGPPAVPNPAPAQARQFPPEDNYGALTIQQAPPADAYYQNYAAQQPQSPAVQNYYDTYYYGNPYAYGGMDCGIGWPVFGAGIIVTSPGFHHGFGHGGFGHRGFGHRGFGHGGFGHGGGGRGFGGGGGRGGGRR